MSNSYIYVKSKYWSGHGLTCLGGSPSHDCTYVTQTHNRSDFSYLYKAGGLLHFKTINICSVIAK